MSSGRSDEGLTGRVIHFRHQEPPMLNLRLCNKRIHEVRLLPSSWYREGRPQLRRDGEGDGHVSDVGVVHEARG